MLCTPLFSRTCMYARTFIANIRWCIDRFYDFTIQARQEQSSRCVHPRRNRLLADKKGSQYSIQPPPRTSTRVLIPSTTSAGPVACENTDGLWTCHHARHKTRRSRRGTGGYEKRAASGRICPTTALGMEKASTPNEMWEASSWTHLSSLQQIASV